MNGPSLYVFGGNNTRSPHDFSKTAFSNEAYRFDIATRVLEKLPDLPQPVQAASAQIAGSRVDQSIYVFVGLGHVGEKLASQDTLFQYRLRSKAWSEEIGRLPATRSIFQSTNHIDAFWVFGGSQVNTMAVGISKASGTGTCGQKSHRPWFPMPKYHFPVIRLVARVWEIDSTRWADWGRIQK